MSYSDNLIIAAYTSPISSTRTTWKYREKLTTEFKMRLVEMRYHRVSGVEYYGLGDDGDDLFPMVCVFDGDTHDEDAKKFVLSLREVCYPGKPGILEHPVHGVKPVVVRSVKVSTDPTNDMAQTIVEIVFALQLDRPESGDVSYSVQVQKQFDATLESSQTDFENNVDVSSASGKVSLADTLRTSLKKIASECNELYKKQASVLTAFTQTQTDILNNIDTIIKTPATLAAQTQIMVSAIASLPGDLLEKIKAWKDLYTATGGSSEGITVSDTELKNKIAMKELISVAAISNIANQVVSQIDEFSNADAMLFSYYDLVTTFGEMSDNLDEYAKDFDDLTLQEQVFTMTETAAEIKTLILLCGAAVREKIATLPAGTVITLSSDKPILQICWEYYNDISDDTIDSFIENNDLSLLDFVYIARGTSLNI